MIKKGILIISLILLTSCDAYKSMFVFSRFTIKPNTNVEAFKIIDTTSIYKEVESINLTYKSKQNFSKREYLYYMRFKKNGEMVRLFTNKLANWKNRESELNRKQRYNYSKKGFYIEYHFHTIQGGWSIWKAKLLKHTNDSLVFKHKDYITKYVKTTITEKKENLENKTIANKKLSPKNKSQLTNCSQKTLFTSSIKELHLQNANRHHFSSTQFIRQPF